MHTDLNETIVALSSASGVGARAIVRLTGPDSVQVISNFFECNQPPTVNQRRLYIGTISLPGTASTLPADIYVLPAPATYTGQLLVEIHTLSCPPLVELLISQCLSAGARAAGPGEFTMRAFLSGKLDLTRAEAVLAVIEAGTRDELQQALGQLAGGVATPLQELRTDLLDLLADVEAGLDFADEDIEFTEQENLLTRISKGMALIKNIRQQLDRRATTDQPFRVVLAGHPNAGKSSLFNALARGTAIVSNIPGTTRDYLLQRMDLDGVNVELVDTAGWQSQSNGVEGKAQELGDEQLNKSDLILLCIESGKSVESDWAALRNRTSTEVMPVFTKCDLHTPLNTDHPATSAVERIGLIELRTLLADKARDQSRPALAPSLSRCRHHVDTCLEHLRRAHHTVLEEEPPELLALEVRGALDQLGEMVGAVYTDDLLDRVFSRFCIGK